MLCVQDIAAIIRQAQQELSSDCLLCDCASEGPHATNKLHVLSGGQEVHRHSDGMMQQH